ncbi:hypothetical protein AXE65_07720 [Ventosimonas gracilis]|uniref:H repeat-associated protein N-terminal domain-containing protein n=1 Tax=Ventosimonas gracilis TaxID=1680762 RepID=A0A139SHN8_9GAMM|nr:ISAs1 family transposase [Ventosimonas gracilis]KXU34092.1 hypothetical protein AXE65_07720 [Ventosimonas gracilis]
MKCCCPCLLATLAGAETFVDIALFGVKKRELLRRFLPFAQGTPSHDPLGDLLATLDAECFQRCFAAWVASFTGLSEDVIAIDGKTSRRAKQGGKTLLHTVSAFCARQRLVLGQTKVDEKSNEITAIQGSRVKCVVLIRVVLNTRQLPDRMLLSYMLSRPIRLNEKLSYLIVFFPTNGA